MLNLNLSERFENSMMKLIQAAVGFLVAAGGLAMLYLEYGQTAALFSVVSTLGVLHLVIEYKADAKGGVSDK